MTANVQVLLKNSGVKGKLPDAASAVYGELFINYHSGDPMLCFKDNAGEIIQIKPARSIDGGGGETPPDTGNENGDTLWNGTQLLVWDTDKWIPVGPGDLAYVQKVDKGEVTNTAGNGFEIPAVNNAQAGLMLPGDKNNLDDLVAGGASLWERSGNDLSPKTSGDNLTDVGSITVAGDAVINRSVKVGGTPGSPEIVLQQAGGITCKTVNAVGLISSYLTTTVPADEDDARYGLFTGRSKDLTVTAQILGDGSITAAGGVLSNKFFRVESDNDAYAPYRITNQAGDRTYEISAGGTVQIGGTIPSDPNIQLKNDGSAEFKGDVSVGDSTTEFRDKAEAIAALTPAQRELYKTAIEAWNARPQPYAANDPSTLPADLPLREAIVRATTAGKINLNGDSGSITAAGDIQVDKNPATTGAVLSLKSASTWGFRSNKVGGANEYGLDIYRGGDGTDVKLSIDKDGSIIATRSGIVGFGLSLENTSDVYNSSMVGLKLAEPDGTYNPNFIYCYDDSSSSQKFIVKSDGTTYIGGSEAGSAISLKSDGSITAAGNIQSGESNIGGTKTGAYLLANGVFGATRENNGDTLWTGYKTGSSTPTSTITADGSITTAGSGTFNEEIKLTKYYDGVQMPSVRFNNVDGGDLQIQMLGTSGDAEELFRFEQFADGKRGSLLIGGTLPSAPNINLKGSDGSITAAGTITPNTVVFNLNPDDPNSWNVTEETYTETETYEIEVPVVQTGVGTADLVDGDERETRTVTKTREVEKTREVREYVGETLDVKQTLLAITGALEGLKTAAESATTCEQLRDAIGTALAGIAAPSTGTADKKTKSSSRKKKN